MTVTQRPVPRCHDQWGRALAVCFAGDVELDREMVRQGWALAWHPERDAVPGPPYDTELVEAEEAQRGRSCRRGNGGSDRRRRFPHLGIQCGGNLLQGSQKRQGVGRRWQEKAEPIIPQPRLFVLGMDQNSADPGDLRSRCGAQKGISD